jgi:extracellular factor (EF) 3-hydroxypalmitic acid methyl ester biosynthesis protein
MEKMPNGSGEPHYPYAELRQHQRRPYVKTLECAVISADFNAKMNLKARTFEISDSGIGIETDYPLAPGHMLWLSGEIDKAGVVRWCIKRDNNYRAGIKLKTAEDYTNSILESVRENAILVAEEREKYGRLLDMATEHFNRTLEALEERCLDPHESPEKLLKAIETAVHEVLAVCAEFEKAVKDKDIIRNARVRFHEKTNPILSKSFTINRTRTWPQGAQGDYKTLEIIYRNTPLSEGIGYYLDVCFLNAPLAIGVRNRIKKLEGLLRDELQERQQPSILNIACGSCRELMGIAPEIVDSQAKIICVDTDNDALAFAQDRFSYAGILPQVELRKYNALRMFDDEMNMMEFGKQDIIYSAGLFDYLPDDFLIKLLRALYALLNPGGKLIAAFKDADRYRHQEYHWFADWYGFLQRREEDFRTILSKAGIPSSGISELRDDSGIIIFYLMTK